MLNVARLQAVKREILAHPDELDMTDWCLATWRRTTRCIAGRTVAMFGTPVQRFWRGRLHVSPDSLDVCEQACDLLGLPYCEARDLFYVNRWPQIFQSSMRMAETAEVHAEVTGTMIDHFISKHSDQGWLRPVKGHGTAAHKPLRRRFDAFHSVQD